jgi:Carboxypeptidase regulatory-like domain
MTKNLVFSKFVLALLVSLAVLFACTSPAWAQTSATGALTGTVTDPSGGVIVNATVELTNKGTGQARSTTTDSAGEYKFSLLQPGNYSVKVSASGFKTAEVDSVTVNVAETPVLNQKLEIGAQTEQVTVESTAETIQTQNATNGGVVSSQEITELPLVSRNYTQVVNLSPGVVSNVSSAAAVGNGTGDVAVNGARQNQNNYSMDGSSVVNYVSGTAGQTGSYPGIVIPNPDSIQEFKVQTSQYDASSGRNPGANVDVVTRTGQNQFHGAAWEFNRNNFFNANDFFYKRYELSQPVPLPNKPQTLKQNTFGGTLGGPILKDKLFFFGSYQGIRQINGIGTSGFAAGYEPNTLLMPWNDVADFKSGVCSDLRCTNNVPAYKAYLGSVFAGESGFIAGTGRMIMPCVAGDVTCNSTNITNTAVGMLQAKGIVPGGFNQGFDFPSAPPGCKTVTPGLTASGCLTAISDPTTANENQYMINTQYILSNKNTLEERYIYQSDPQIQSFLCFITPGNCNPGTPQDVTYTNHVGQLKLVTLVTSNFVNEARFSFQRNIENGQDPNPAASCDLPNGATIIPLENNGLPCPPANTTFSEFNKVPILDILGVGAPNGPWSQGGNFSMTSTNFINTYQFGDQISWNHKQHAIRAGFEGERILYNNTIPASGRGELLMWSTADFLTSSFGPAVDGTPVTPNGGIVLGFGLAGQLTHYNRINAFDGYVQDDIKLTRKLTVNLGVRWEYDGFPDDKSGDFANVWASQIAKENTGSFFLNQPIDPTYGRPDGTLIGFVVPSNFAVKQFGLTAPGGAGGVLVNSNKTLVPGTPWHDFGPRLGVAWQPLSDRFVVRAGYGMFYDRIYGNLLIDNQLNLPPYSGAASGPSPQNLENTLHDPYEAGAIQPTPLVWTPRYIYATGPGAYVSSGFGYTSDSNQMANRLPLIQEYNLDLQYEFAHGWVADIGYVGSHGAHLYNWSQDINVARLIPGAPGNQPIGFQNTELLASSLPFNDPANTNPVTSNTKANADERVAYLGFAPTGVATTNTNGDSLYNSLQAQLKHQFSKGLLLQVAYTWSKAFTNVNTAEAGSGINPPGEVLYGSSNSNDPLDLRQQYGLAAFNRPQRVVISYSYDFPWRRTEGFTGKALSGWSISGVTTIQDGLPFSLSDSQGASIYFGTGSANSRAALADPVNCNPNTGNCKSGVPLISSGSTTSRAINGWLNTSAYIPLGSITASSPYCIGGTPNPGGNANAPCGAAPSPAPPGFPFFGEGATFVGAGSGFGNTAVGIISGPGQFNFDMALIKNTKLWEGTTLQFRTEFYNLWNHPQFAPPFGVDASTPSTFGVITSTSTTPRVMQFGLKLLF